MITTINIQTTTIPITTVTTSITDPTPTTTSQTTKPNVAVTSDDDANTQPSLPCDRVICANGATCKTDENQVAVCYCALGFEGHRCGQAALVATPTAHSSKPYYVIPVVGAILLLLGLGSALAVGQYRNKKKEKVSHAGLNPTLFVSTTSQ